MDGIVILKAVPNTLEPRHLHAALQDTLILLFHMCRVFDGEQLLAKEIQVEAGRWCLHQLQLHSRHALLPCKLQVHARAALPPALHVLQLGPFRFLLRRLSLDELGNALKICEALLPGGLKGRNHISQFLLHVFHLITGQLEVFELVLLLLRPLHFRL